LVIGIRESATTNAILVGIKVGVVLFVIAVGMFWIQSAYWNDIPASERLKPEDILIRELSEKESTGGKLTSEVRKQQQEIIGKHLLSLVEEGKSGKVTEKEARKRVDKTVAGIQELMAPYARLDEAEAKVLVQRTTGQVTALYRLLHSREEGGNPLTKQERGEVGNLTVAKRNELLAPVSAEEKKEVLAGAQRRMKAGRETADITVELPKTDAEALFAGKVLAKVYEEAPKEANKKWGLLGL